MESWFQRIFLIVSLVLPAFAAAQESSTTDDQVLDTVISPDIERRTIDEDLIDSENVELGLYGGVMSIEDFASNNTYGVRAAYHVTQDVFVEATYGTTEAGESSYEILNPGVNLIPDDRLLTFYNLSLGLNLLQGEVFFGKNKAFNTAYYFIGGVGNTQFAGDEYFTVNYGTGLRFFATDSIAVRFDFRNHLMSHTIFGEEKSIQNLEGTLGLSLYF